MALNSCPSLFVPSPATAPTTPSPALITPLPVDITLTKLAPDITNKIPRNPTLCSFVSF